MNNLKELSILFNSTFPEIINIFKKLNLTPILIGGVTRNYLLDGKLATDIDMEVQVDDLKVWEQLTNDLSSIAKIEILAFKIITFDYQDFNFELTLPRKEKFNGSIGHKNFTVDFYPRLKPQESFSRRDFTVNAIGLNPLTGDEIDPFEGLIDIEKKMIKPISENFALDPVRFIRAARFKSNLGFNYHPDFLGLAQNEKLLGLSGFALNREWAKAKSAKKFAKEIFELFPEFELSESFQFWDSLLDGPMENNLVHLCILKNQVSESYIQFFGLSTKSYKRMIICLNTDNPEKNMGRLKEKEKKSVLDFLKK